MASQPGKQIFAIHISISRSRGNERLKFGQFMEYNMRNLSFFGKSYTKCGGVTIPKHFSKKLKLSKSLNQ